MDAAEPAQLEHCQPNESTEQKIATKETAAVKREKGSEEMHEQSMYAGQEPSNEPDASLPPESEKSPEPAAKKRLAEAEDIKSRPTKRTRKTRVWDIDIQVFAGNALYHLFPLRSRPAAEPTSRHCIPTWAQAEITSSIPECVAGSNAAWEREVQQSESCPSKKRSATSADLDKKIESAAGLTTDDAACTLKSSKRTKLETSGNEDLVPPTAEPTSPLQGIQSQPSRNTFMTC